MSKQTLSDDLLKEAVAKAFDMEAAAYKKMAEQAEEHQFSTEYREKLQELSKERPDSKKHKIVKFSRKSIWMRIAVVAVLVMAMGTTVLAVEPLRKTVYRMIEHIFPNHTDIRFEMEEENLEDQDWEVDMTNYPRRLKRVPEGYVLFLEEDFMEEPEIELPDFTQIYSNSKNQELSYTQVLTENYDASITSDGTSAKRIKVGNDQAYLFTDDDNYHGIVLEKDGFVYTIGGYDDVEELVACLESVFDEE